MLPDQLRARVTAFAGFRHGLLAGVCAALVLSACSTMPEPSYPAHADHRFRASFLIGAEGRLPLLSTTKDVVVRELQLDPEPTTERFSPDGRWFVYPPGTTVKVRGALRVYQAADGSIPALKDLLQTEAARMTSLTDL